MTDINPYCPTEISVLGHKFTAMWAVKPRATDCGILFRPSDYAKLEDPAYRQMLAAAALRLLDEPAEAEDRSNG